MILDAMAPGMTEVPVPVLVLTPAVNDTHVTMCVSISVSA